MALMMRNGSLSLETYIIYSLHTCIFTPLKHKQLPRVECTPTLVSLLTRSDEGHTYMLLLLKE